MILSIGKYTLFYRALDDDDVCLPKLQSDTMEIIEEFTKIRDGFYEYSKYKPGAINELRWILKDWIYCGTIEENDRFQNITKDSLEDVDDFVKLWSIFSSYCSFFNFGLLERAISVISYQEGKSKITEYKVKFADYIKKRVVTQCPSNLGMKGTDHIELFFKLDKPYAKCRMAHLMKLAKDICVILNAEKEKLQLEGVQNGCICVTFHLHKSAVPNGFFLTRQQIQHLSRLRYEGAKILKLIYKQEHYLINAPSVGKLDDEYWDYELLHYNLVKDNC